MKTKTVKLPSGLEVTIRKPGAVTWFRAFGDLPIVAGGESRAISVREHFESTKTLILCCSSEPKFAEEPGQGVTALDELSVEDFWALGGEIVAFSGVLEAAQTVNPSPVHLESS